jgi:deoxyribonuclease V
VGEHEVVPDDRGGRSALTHDGEVVGAVVRTRTGVKPVFASPGHLVDVDSAVEVVLRTTGRFRLPEPIRLAHLATKDLMRRMDPKQRPPRTRHYANYRRASDATSWS